MFTSREIRASIGFDKLLNEKSEQWGVGPAIRLPIFDGGRLRANLRSRTADLDAAIAASFTARDGLRATWAYRALVARNLALEFIEEQKEVA